jgi:hypothetical protein
MSVALPLRPLPLVGVTPTEKMGGVSRLDAESARAAGGIFHVLRFDEALEKRWETDAWFVPYKLVGFGNLKAGWPRFRQDALGDVRAQGADIVATMLVLDFDLPKIPSTTGEADRDGKPKLVKQRWTQELLDAFLAKFEQASAEGFEFADDWTVFYTTNHGARVIFVLDEALAVERYKPYMKGLISAFISAGIPIDGTTECMDWTHLFRLPSSSIPAMASPRRPLSSRSARRIGSRSSASLPSGLTIRLASDAKCASSTARGRATARSPSLLTETFISLAKKWLRGHPCYESLFEHTRIAPAGRRIRRSRVTSGTPLISFSREPTSQSSTFMRSFTSRSARLSSPTKTRPIGSSNCGV